MAQILTKASSFQSESPSRLQISSVPPTWKPLKYALWTCPLNLSTSMITGLRFWEDKVPLGPIASRYQTTIGRACEITWRGPCLSGPMVVFI